VYRKNLAVFIQIDEEQIQQHLGNLVRGTVKETLSKLLDAEAPKIMVKERKSSLSNNKGTP